MRHKIVLYFLKIRILTFFYKFLIKYYYLKNFAGKNLILIKIIIYGF